MSKDSIKIILITVIVIAMLGILKSLFFPKNDAQLSEAIKEGAYLVDVRTPGEFSSGSVEGAVNIPLNQVDKQLSKFKNKEKIVVFCRSGARSAQAKSILNENGIENVINGGSWKHVNKIKKD